MKILIVKMSALGDVIQAIPLAKWLKSLYPEASIHWILEKRFQGALTRSPHIEKVLPFDKGAWWKTARLLREEKYDYVFDIQGNMKSGLITLLAKGKRKVGLDASQVREWPSTLATTDRILIDTQLPMADQYIQVAQKFFQKKGQWERNVLLPLTKKEEEEIEELVQKAEGRPILMICPASAWENKRVSLATWAAFIKKIEEKFDPFFFFIFGSTKEKADAEHLHKHCPESSAVIGSLPIPVWQNLMTKTAGVLSVDSSALHLAGLAPVPTFSIFGPTHATIFQPVGPLHTSFQGACPYGEKFPKQCKYLRDCKTGQCIKGITAEELFERFLEWYSSLNLFRN